MINKERVEKLLGSYKGEIVPVSENKIRLFHLNEFDGGKTMTRIEVTLPSKESSECEIYATTKYRNEWEPKPFIGKYKSKEQRFFMSDLVHCLDTFHFVKRDEVAERRERIKALEKDIELAFENYEDAVKNGSDFMAKHYKEKLMKLKKEKEELGLAERES